MRCLKMAIRINRSQRLIIRGYLTMELEPGLDAGWMDGRDVCGLLVRAPIERMDEVFQDGRVVIDSGAVVDPSPAETGIIAAQLVGSEWTHLEVLRPTGEKDYLLVSFDELLQLCEGRTPETDAFHYETVGSLAAVATAKLKTKALTFWGSDEQWGICAGAHFANGKLVEWWSDFPVEQIRAAREERARSLDDESDLDEDDDDELPGFHFRDGEFHSFEEGEDDVEDRLDQVFQSHNAPFALDVTPFSLYLPPDSEEERPYPFLAKLVLYPL